MIDDLIYDLTIRFPRDKIVYKTDRYMILAGDKYIREVPQEIIDELVDNSLVYINEHKDKKKAYNQDHKEAIIEAKGIL